MPSHCHRHHHLLSSFSSLVFVILIVLVIRNLIIVTPSMSVLLSKSARNASSQKIGCCVKNRGCHDRCCHHCSPSEPSEVVDSCSDVSPNHQQAQLIVGFNLLRQARPSCKRRNYLSPRRISTKPSAPNITNGVWKAPVHLARS